MCLTDYIGIRGECELAKLYIDDLPGIDIVKASKITNESYLRPIDIVRKAFNQAQKEVLQDVLSKVNLDYNQILDTKNYTYAGNYEYYGLVNDEVKLKIHKRDYIFTKLSIPSFDLVSDRAITKDFVINDGHGVTKIITIALVAGLNNIVLDYSPITTSSDYISITFSLLDFKIGVKETFTEYNQIGNCMACSYGHNHCDCSYLEVYVNGVFTANNKIGFNLMTRCESDECTLIKNLCPILDLPLLYKTGINYLLEAKMSGRINSYLRNTEDSIEHMLSLWQGGYDNQNQTNIPSIYWQKVKQVSEKVTNLLKAINSPLFTHSGTNICNSLP